MPHLIDFDGLESSLFILQHTAYGSKEFCEKFNLKTDCYGVDYEWWEYKGILKTYVSNMIIEAAIKVRMLQDFVKNEDADVDLDQIDSNARKGLAIANRDGLSAPLKLRQSCNKIVHATEASMQWIKSVQKPDVEYWSGVYELFGMDQGKKWEIALNIPEWCTGMIRFNKIIQDSVDWESVYKYDI